MEPVERICARVLTKVEETFKAIRAVLEEESIGAPRSLLHAICLGVLRNYKLVEHVLRLCGYRGRVRGSPAGWLPLVVGYEALFRRGVVKPTRLKYTLKGGEDVVECLLTIDIEEVVKELKRKGRLDIVYSVPGWVVKFLEKAKPPGGVEAVLEGFSKPTPQWIRFNRSLITVKEALTILSGHGVEARPDPVLDDVVEVLKARPGSIPSLDPRLFYVQDRSAALVAHVLGDNPSYVIDLFSSPGNKVAHLEWRAPRLSVGLDIAPARAFIEQRLLRAQGVVGIDIVSADARLPPLRKGFDAALVDPDCSSIGRIGHSPEARLFLEVSGPSIVYRLQRLQLQGLRTAANLVRKGGIVVYSTCTLTVEENEEVVMKAVGEGLFELLEAMPLIGVWSPILEKTQRIYPHISRCGGGFVAKLLRV